MRLIRLVIREIPDHLRPILLMAALGALSSTVLMWLVDVAAQDAAKGQISGRLVLLFAVTVTLFATTNNYVLVTASQDAEKLVHRLRIRLFDAVRRTDMITIERIGRAALHGALTQDTQTVARCLPFLVIGAQQAIMLVFLGVYLAWLSPVACILAFGFSAVSLGVRFARMRSLGSSMRDAATAETGVFDGLSDMLGGFKEVRMSTLRADGLVSELEFSSSRARRIKSRTKAQWGWEFALLQTMFYALVGLMVFVVPLFAKGYDEVVVAVTMTTLFIVGPVGTLAHVTPMMTETELALANIEALDERLRQAAREGTDEAAEPLPAPASIALDQAVFSYADPDGRPVFAVGPLSLSFRAGEIAFVTGGNGSGKSTMLRLLTGLAPLEGGVLLADGKPVAAGQMQAYRDQFSAIFSDHHLSRRIYGLSAVDPDRVETLLRSLEMEKKVQLADGAFSTVDLSTGQRKRLALLVAELEDKPIVIFDEWAADQDPHFRKIFYEKLLPDFKARGKIVICVTHDDRWFARADRIYHMADGLVAGGEAA